MSRRDIYVTICKILLQLFSIRASHVSVSNYIFLIMKFYTVPVRLNDVKNVVNPNTRSANKCPFFYRENMTSFLNYVTATLRVLFAWRGSYNENSLLKMKSVEVYL